MGTVSPIIVALQKLQQQLAAIDPSFANWSRIETWVAGVRPFLRHHFPDEVADFNELSKQPQWLWLPRVIGLGRENLSANADQLEIAANNRKTQDTVDKLLAFLDTLVGLGDREPNTPRDTWALSPGDEVDGWTLVDRLGKGGNGEVWVATRSEVPRAALKVLKPKFQDSDHKRYCRFRDEVTQHKHLAERHPGVLPFISCSLPDNPTRLTPAWLATSVATPIRLALKERPLREAVEAIESVAETLASLHEVGVAHRDIKPDNLFQYEAQWVVGDFGLVDYPDKESLTDTGERLGPYHYLAPEMQDEAKRADGRRADVYSLGKTLWVLATEQRSPLAGEIRADNTQSNIATYRPHPRSHQLDLLIERATKHSPTSRPTMAEFVAELKAVLTTPDVRPQQDVSELLVRVRVTAGVSPEVERVRIIEGFNRLYAKLTRPIEEIAHKLVETGLSDGNTLSGGSGKSYFYGTHRNRAHPSGFITSSERFCRASFSVANSEPAPTVELSCVAGVSVYADGTAFLFGGFYVGFNVWRGEVIGLKEWRGVLGSAMQDQAVAELAHCLNENLGPALEAFAKWIQEVKRLASPADTSS